MKIDVAAVRKCLKSFDFQTLFREHLGWDNHQARLDIPVDGDTVCLTAVAQKRGFVAFRLSRSIPDRPTRLKIDHQVTKSVREHFVIYADQASGPTGLALGPPRAGQAPGQPRPSLRHLPVRRPAHPAAGSDRRQSGGGRGHHGRGCRRPGQGRLRRGQDHQEVLRPLQGRARGLPQAHQGHQGRRRPCSGTPR